MSKKLIMAVILGVTVLLAGILYFQGMFAYAAYAAIIGLCAITMVWITPGPEDEYEPVTNGAPYQRRRRFWFSAPSVPSDHGPAALPAWEREPRIETEPVTTETERRPSTFPWRNILYILGGIVVLGALFFLISSMSMPDMGTGSFGSFPWHWMPHVVATILIIWKLLRSTSINDLHYPTIFGLATTMFLGGLLLVPQSPLDGWLLVTGLIPLLIAILFFFAETPETFRRLGAASIWSVVLMLLYSLGMMIGFESTETLVWSLILATLLLALIPWFRALAMGQGSGTTATATAAPYTTYVGGNARNGFSTSTLGYVALGILVFVLLAAIFSAFHGTNWMANIAPMMKWFLTGTGLLVVLAIIWLSGLSTRVKAILSIIIAVLLLQIAFGFIWPILLYPFQLIWWALQWIYHAISTNIIAFGVVFGLILLFIFQNWNTGWLQKILIALLLFGAMSLLFGSPIGTRNITDWPSFPAWGEEEYIDPGPFQDSEHTYPAK
jgi:hypothetical protein